jgi:hypothetical protein
MIGLSFCDLALWRSEALFCETLIFFLFTCSSLSRAAADQQIGHATLKFCSGHKIAHAPSLLQQLSTIYKRTSQASI